MKILFVCTGNTCRSPMAEGIAKKLFGDWKASSCGLCVNPGEKVSENAVGALKDFRIDISAHIPTMITKELIAENDIIVPMTRNHKDLLLKMGVPETKIHTFKDNISDPYDMPIEMYKMCSSQLKNNIIILHGELNEINKA